MSEGPKKGGRFSRRSLLKLAGGLGLSSLLPARRANALDEFEILDVDPLRTYPYRGWESLYTDQYTWDAVGRSTHSANCTGSCSWLVYVKDGVMLREEQSADYPRINQELPDYNPRGCQKGACYVEYVHGAQRIKYPLLRVGERGEGKWRRISWDEALTRIAENLIDNLYEHGPDTNTFFSVIPAMSPISFSAGIRLAHLLGGVSLTFYDWYCDLPPGEPITWGVQTEACECADWFNSKYIVLWGSNISETRIPDAHFAWEARYNGARVACVSPDYNASAVHADQYLRIEPGTDALLALAVCRRLIEGQAYDADYIKVQTDLPLLVRTDTNRFLRGSDMGSSDGTPDEVFFVWDKASGRPAPVPGSMGSKTKTLDLGGLDPSLRGRWKVSLADGGRVEVTTVLEQLAGQLADEAYGLEAVGRRCGIAVADLERFADDFATRKPAMIIHGAGTNHWYHNDLMNRAMILIVALTGNVGKNGGGFNHYVGQERVWPEHGFLNLAFPKGPKKQRFQNTTLWTYCHSKVRDPDPVDGRPVEAWILDALREGTTPLWPKDDWRRIRPEQLHDLARKPRSLIIWRANYLNQAKGNEAILRSLWQDLDLIVDINYRMDTTALHSDIVLPAASYYEKNDLSSTDCHSFIHPLTRVLEPLHEARTDWDIFAALTERIEQIAEKRGLAPYHDGDLDWDRDLTKLVDEWTEGGALKTDADACNHLMAHSVETQGIRFEDLKDGPKRFVATDPASWNSDLEPGRAYTPYTHQIEKLRPWRTLTGRQQFYVDHPWFLQLGEQLPVHKEPHGTDDYPLFWNTPHGRWSIHSTWRDNRYLLRLQRGLPVVYIAPQDAAARGIRDDDWVRVFNQYGEAVLKVKLKPGERPGRLTMYHGWEKFLGFQSGGWQSQTTIRIKPTQLVRYGHLKFRPNYWGPTGNNRDTRVQIEKYSGPVAKYWAAASAGREG